MAGPVRDRSELADLAWSRWVLRAMADPGPHFPVCPLNPPGAVAAAARLFSAEQSAMCGQRGW